MGSPKSRIVFRIMMVILLLLLLFYIGRPLYWKISATVYDIRNNKQTVRQGLSQFVIEAQKSVGGIHRGLECFDHLLFAVVALDNGLDVVLANEPIV